MTAPLPLDLLPLAEPMRPRTGVRHVRRPGRKHTPRHQHLPRPTPADGHPFFGSEYLCGRCHLFAHLHLDGSQP